MEEDEDLRMKVQIVIDKSSLEWIRHLRLSIPHAVGVGVKQILIFGMDTITENIRNGSTGLHPRSGGLAKAWHTRGGAIQVVEETKVGAHGALRCNHPASRVLNEGSDYLPGGVVTPKKSKLLAIPLAAAKTPAGTPKWSSPREVAGLVLIKTKAQNLLLVRTEGSVRSARELGRETGRVEGSFKGRKATAKQTIVPFFVLVESVKIPAFHYLDKSVADVDKKSAQIMDGALQATINKAVA